MWQAMKKSMRWQATSRAMAGFHGQSCQLSISGAVHMSVWLNDLLSFIPCAPHASERFPEVVYEKVLSTHSE